MKNRQNKPHGLTRKKILEIAFAQFRKKRAEIDSGLLEKIRQRIFSNPDLMKNLGVTAEDSQSSEEESVVQAQQGSEDKKRLQSHVETILKDHEKQQQALLEKEKPKEEAVDKKKTLETLSKLIKIRPEYKN